MKHIQSIDTEIIPAMTTKEQNAKIKEFIATFAQGKAAWQKCGEIMVELVDADPYVYNYIEQECQAMTPQLLRMFEDIGRGKVLPSLAFDNSEPAKIMRRFPLPMQARLECEPIPLVVRKDDGKLDVRLVKLTDMTKDQRAQAIDKDRLRTEGQQRALLDEQSSRAAIIDIKAKAVQQAYVVKNGTVTFAAGSSFTRKHLANILAQLS
jgi:hypothetical protein